MSITQVSFSFAGLLCFGSLVFYFLLAFTYRSEPDDSKNAEATFNLGIPRLKDVNVGFASSLLAAGTSLATVLVFFLTATAAFGWWLLLCPFLFAAGNFVLYRVLIGAQRSGYMDEDHQSFSGRSGLVPQLVYRLTANRFAGWLVLALSLLNLLSVLSLEMIMAVKVIGYLIHGIAGHDLGRLANFTIYSFSILLLLGYVFIGGFRASIASDQYQALALKTAILISFIGLALLTIKQGIGTTFHVIPTVPSSVVKFFILNAVLTNLFAPSVQESSWQRFRAFIKSKDFNAGRATTNAVLQSAWVWILIILVSYALFALTAPGDRSQLSDISGCFDRLQSLNNSWFPLLIFPLMAVASLSAMYSTADTCVSALLYLIEYSRPGVSDTRSPQTEETLPPSYWFGMLIILGFCLAIYAFVEFAFNPSIYQLVFTVYSNLVILVPSVLLTTICPPATHQTQIRRGFFVIASILIGFASYWGVSVFAITRGGKYLWLNQAAIAIGLFASLIPVLPLYFSRSHMSRREIGQ